MDREFLRLCGISQIEGICLCFSSLWCMHCLTLEISVIFSNSLIT